MEWFKVDIELPEDDFVEQIKVNGKKLCLIKYEQKIYVIQNTCPHAGGILSGGWCKEGNIVCPIHRYEYSLTTGRGAPGQGDYIDIYPTEQREDGLYVGLKESWWKRIF
ncbi:Rieske (2Fe-2S) protein [Pedobacter sp. KR3-3]|uniref:Rieske (2Fe-2S) protein n=1 Tax=Pedobacter albus TaxID=3113905 RepID=A0ABU7I430_9SPHI|nr:Rieske (2Fe-2S) protein [Pedobacter sp. KR3-3]MEE1944152.1 Rieske (2Fe-2S) protein [Pedobacter sp. KR3-3]